MTPRRTSLVLITLTLALVMAWGFSERRRILVRVTGSLLAESKLLEAEDQGPHARWVDDYYTVEELGDRTFAIGEPRYWQQNFSYLIVGSERALLFDAGPGVRDIRPIAESLTDLPITFVPSHLHFDHLGDGVDFSSVAVVDLPDLRERAENGRLTPTTAEHLGFAEGFAPPTLTVTEWIAPGSSISLGDRSILVLHTPGHTPDSITLVELSTALIFSGDFIYPGPLLVFLPGSAMGDYLEGAKTLLESAHGASRILSAHRMASRGLPELSLRDVEDLEGVLQAIYRGEQSGEGLYPVTYEINERISLIAEPRWLQRW